VSSEIGAIRLAGAGNFRDLGGHRTGNGGHVRRGLVFRSNSLVELTDEDVDVLRDVVGVGTVIDLRGPAEAAVDGRGPLVGAAVRYLSLPITHEPGEAESPVPTADGLVSHYLGYLRQSAANLVSALALIGEGDGRAVIFHCSAGKDRAGVLAALLLAGLGVDERAIAADYAGGGLQGDALVAFLRRRPTFSGRIDSIDRRHLASDPATMLTFLRHLETGWGGPLGWLVEAGLSCSTLAALRRRLIEP
jgi:rhodanese-related sulfurtransferase